VGRGGGVSPEILEACRRLPLGRRRRVTFEYVLLAGVNDSTAEADRLATRLADLAFKAKVNLIPLNEAPSIAFRRSARSRHERKIAERPRARRKTARKNAARYPTIMSGTRNGRARNWRLVVRL